ncbi:1-phosphofructokinase family hexose kinase [Sanguibacter sp. Leaf3]|uniref:1-phosphofructokinase family hexose kinase n=1 Tax=Sanguibacter sp. Leaf3 TaxID=1736209 RepID=UPI0006F9C329|nr:1-phosphofructokinase family hexose kinase [Sanguibacter sp. Leaf3]KQU00076.1 1-phosphofructokinase [Sanguibacter sp. Leaf3]
MIITITPNPSLDRTLEVQVLEPGEVNRAHATRVDAGGKGINVTRALSADGFSSVAIFPSGGSDGARLVAELRDGGVVARPVETGTDTRSNITVVDGRGSTTKINAPGAPMTEAAVQALLDALADEVRLAVDAGEHVLVVGAGSLPAGAGDDFYVRVAQVAARSGVPTVLDTSGAPLRAAVAAGGLTLVKPNEDELAELVGRPLTTVGAVVDAAHQVMESGVTAVLVSLGAHGALLVAPGSVLWAGGPALVPASTVGAGDVTLAGFLSALVDAPHGPASVDPEISADALRRAVAWGRAAVLLPGSAVPAPHDIHLDDVETLTDPSRHIALKEL